MSMVLLALASAAFMVSLYFIISNVLLTEVVKTEKRVKTISSYLVATIKKNQPKERKSLNIFAWFSEGKALKMIASELSLASIPLRAGEFMIIWISVAILPAGLLVLFKINYYASAVLLIAGIILPPFLVRRTKAKRMVLFDKQLSEALTIMGNCLRAGFSFGQSIDSIAREMPDPIAKEFSRVIREIKLGLPIEKALANMVIRLENRDLELIVSAVLIQRQVGGNLSEILDSIASTIKDRIKIKGEIKVLTATGRTSGLIVGLLPVFLLGVLMIINPSYVSMFFNTTAGIGMLLGSCVLELTGLFIVKRIVDIKF